MIEDKELVKLNIRQVLVVSVSLNLVGPAVVFVFLAHTIDLLIVVGQLLRQTDVSSSGNLGLRVRLARIDLANLEIDSLLALAHLKVKAHALIRHFRRAHAHEVLPIVEAQSDGRLLEVDCLVVSDEAPGNFWCGGWHLGLQVELVDLEGRLRREHTDCDGAVLALYLVVAVDVVDHRRNGTVDKFVLASEEQRLERLELLAANLINSMLIANDEVHASVWLSPGLLLMLELLFVADVQLGKE